MASPQSQPGNAWLGTVVEAKPEKVLFPSQMASIRVMCFSGLEVPGLG